MQESRLAEVINPHVITDAVDVVVAVLPRFTMRHADVFARLERSHDIRQMPRIHMLKKFR